MLRRITAGFVVVVLMASSRGFSLELGQLAPSFSLAPLQAESPAQLDSRAYRGQVIYVDFWASWCGPCRLSLPQLNTLYRDFSEKGFAVIAVNVDAHRSEALKFLQRRPVDYPVVYDAKRELPALFGVKGMPTAFLLDRQGRVQHIHEGFRPGDAEQLRAMITQLLAQEGAI
ncbi:TlpA family protein disulfide reductase [Spongiibacter sp.]|uniref:TlpA family protein disulfide reductase n=1 Tax=Spongiibacter sp. TaxID=2024860 RepID=UPI0035640493